MADEMSFLDTNVIEQRNRVLCPLFYRIRRPASAVADTAVIEGYGCEMRSERIDLRLPKAAETAKAGNEQHGLAAPGHRITDASASNVNPRHGFVSCLPPARARRCPRSRRSP